MPPHENFDALFAATYQQHELPELLPGVRAQALVAGLDSVLARLDEVAASEIVPRADADLHARLERTLRFYRAVEEFSGSDFLTELHSEADRAVVSRLRDELRSVRATIATAAEAKEQEISAAVKAETAGILAQIEAEQRVQVLGDIINEAVGLRYADEYTDAGAPQLEDWQRALPLPEIFAAVDERQPTSHLEDDGFDDEEFDDEDYDQYDGDEEDGATDQAAQSSAPFEALFGINHEQTPLIARLSAERIDEMLGFVKASLVKLETANRDPQLLGRDSDAWAETVKSLAASEMSVELRRQYRKMVLIYETLRNFPTSEDLQVLRTGEDLRAASLLITALVSFRNELLARKVELNEVQVDGGEPGSA